jgi:hypothetical protein
MRRFVDGVRQRGGRAVTEEDEDLPRLRAEWRRLYGEAHAVTTLDRLGATPVDNRRVAEIRRQIAERAARRTPGARRR